MVLGERQQKILDALIEKESASVEELSSILNVSTVTIRSDLTKLSKLGQVVRTHGGARIAAERVRQEFSFATRQRINAAAKKAIGELAVTLIEPNDSILLDASSTAVAFAQALHRANLPFDINVFSTGIWTALELLGKPNIHVALAGGSVRSTTGSLTGSLAMEILNKFNFNKVFLGAWGIDIINGLTDAPMLEVELKQHIVGRAQQVIAIVDGSKFGKLGLASFARVEQINKIVTDKSAPSEEIKKFRNKGIEVLIA